MQNYWVGTDRTLKMWSNSTLYNEYTVYSFNYTFGQQNFATRHKTPTTETYVKQVIVVFYNNSWQPVPSETDEKLISIVTFRNNINQKC